MVSSLPMDLSAPSIAGRGATAPYVIRRPARQSVPVVFASPHSGQDYPAALVAEAPVGAEHYILTFSHALDLELCHRLLAHGFAACGLIGSATKRARFRTRLAALGHGAGEIARIECPIGDPSLGKHPQAIAVGVAMAFLRRAGTKENASRQENAG